MERILIVRLGAMGDIVHALPAVAALRRAHPEAQIGWAVEERWADLLCADGDWQRYAAGTAEKPLVDQLHFVNLRAWRKALFSDETWKEFSAVRAGLRDAGYEAAIDFQGAWKSAWVATWSEAPMIVGLSDTRERGAAMFYTRKVPLRGEHVIEHAMELAAALGAGHTPLAPQLPRDPHAEKWAGQQSAARGSFAFISPGAGWGAKRWPPERYAEVARALGAHGLNSIVNIGPGEDALADAIEKGSAGRAFRVTCSIGEMIALLRRARLFVGGDTGPLHVAAALGVPTVAIFGPTNPARNGPYGADAIVLRDPESETSYSHVDREHEGLMSIPAAAVIGAARELLSGGARG